MDTELQEKVRQRAYELWQLNGQPDGLAAEFWAMAEKELAGGQSVERPDQHPDQP